MRKGTRCARRLAAAIGWRGNPKNEETPVAGRRVEDAIFGGVKGIISARRMDVKEYLVKTHHSRRGNMQRCVTAYVDGFNLYFGLRDSGSRKHLWLDPVALIRSLLRSNQHLIALKYFTARLSGGRGRSRDPLHDQREGKRVRQSNYIDALSSLPMRSTVGARISSLCRAMAIWRRPSA
jgi:hypothetical protein